MSTPANGSVVLDTSVAIAILNEEPTATAHWQSTDDMILPSVVLGELLYGAQASSRAEENVRKAMGLLTSTRLVTVDLPVCQAYGEIKAGLRSLGHLIPENDIWIASVCVVHNAALASRDRHFDAVANLRRDPWT